MGHKQVKPVWQIVCSPLQVGSILQIWSLRCRFGGYSCQRGHHQNINIQRDYIYIYIYVLESKPHWFPYNRVWFATMDKVDGEISLVEVVQCLQELFTFGFIFIFFLPPKDLDGGFRWSFPVLIQGVIHFGAHWHSEFRVIIGYGHQPKSRRFIVPIFLGGI